MPLEKFVYETNLFISFTFLLLSHLTDLPKMLRNIYSTGMERGRGGGGLSRFQNIDKLHRVPVDWAGLSLSGRGGVLHVQRLDGSHVPNPAQHFSYTFNYQ